MQAREFHDQLVMQARALHDRVIKKVLCAGIFVDCEKARKRFTVTVEVEVGLPLNTAEFEAAIETAYGNFRKRMVELDIMSLESVHVEIVPAGPINFDFFYFPKGKEFVSTDEEDTVHAPDFDDDFMKRMLDAENAAIMYPEEYEPIDRYADYS